MQLMNRRRPLRRTAAGLLASTLLIAAGGLGAARPAAADPMGDTARSLVDKHKDAVVQFQVVVKFSGGPAGDESNQQLEAQGLVIDGSGLIVTSNSAIDPLSAFGDLADSDSPMARITSKVVSVKVLGRDGTELPAKVVLRDPDRNLAYIRLLTPASPALPFVDLKSAGEAQIGEPLYVLGRLGKTGNRGPVVSFNRVLARLERPRLLYVVASGQGFTQQGDIVFNEAGKPLGILNVKIGNLRQSGGRFGGEGLYVVVPADDVLEDGAQAPQVQDVKDTDAAAAPAKPAKPAAPKPAAK